MKVADDENNERNRHASAVLAISGGTSNLRVEKAWKTPARSGGDIEVAIFDDGETHIAVQSSETTAFASCSVTPEQMVQHIEDCRHALTAMR